MHFLRPAYRRVHSGRVALTSPSPPWSNILVIKIADWAPAPLCAFPFPPTLEHYLLHLSSFYLPILPTRPPPPPRITATRILYLTIKVRILNAVNIWFLLISPALLNRLSLPPAYSNPLLSARVVFLLVIVSLSQVLSSPVYKRLAFSQDILMLPHAPISFKRNRTL